jgi:hypothetical protein
MDFSTLLQTVGLWPALVLLLGWWIDKIRREQLADRDKQLLDRDRTIDELEAEARKAVEAKNAELAEWKQRALDRRRSR